MRKNSLLLVACFCTITLYGQTDTNDVKNSRVGKLIYNPVLKDIEKVSSIFDVWDMGDNPGKKDMLLLDYEPFFFNNLTLNVRISKLDDGRIIIISHSSRRPSSFYIIIKYIDKDELDSDKVVECRVDPEGSIIELSTKYGVDPNGKKGIVLYNDKKTSEMNDTLKTSKKVFSFNDSLVQRYQNEINKVLLLFNS